MPCGRNRCLQSDPEHYQIEDNGRQIDVRLSQLELRWPDVVLGRFREALFSLLDEDDRELIRIDLGRTRLIASDLLAMFVQFHRRGLKVELRSLSQPVCDFLEHTQLNLVLSVPEMAQTQNNSAGTGSPHSGHS